MLDENDVEFVVEDKRAKNLTHVDIATNFAQYDRALRDYQENVVQAAMARGRGVLSVATGGGKTMISCELIARMGVAPVVFIVPSKTLMYQTQREFAKYLTLNGMPAKVGIAGDGVCDLESVGVNVMTWQTALQAFDEKYTAKGDRIVYDEFTGLVTRKKTDQLRQEAQDAEKKLEQAKLDGTLTKDLKNAARKAKNKYDTRLQHIAKKEAIKALVQNCGVFIVDEAHTAAVVIQRLGEHASNAFYRFGVTATNWREDGQEIRIEGTFGRNLIVIKPSDLIRDKWLVPPVIFMVKIRHLESTSDYTEVYDKHIVRCWERNYRIKQFAEQMFAAGRAVMILVERLDHGDILEQMIEQSVFVPGKDNGSGLEDDADEDTQNYRLGMLAKCGSRKHILIATQWANVGVDEPSIDTLILAGSSMSSVTTFQQVGRILRPAKGKNNAVVIDFMDEQEDLHSHSLRRKRAYALEPEFRVYMVT
ncbi:MAG: DEAD/DEAH box helicase family protein [Armatimonadetes bacterium]|nr:DEAD/DEAH box helicase family protein [Armatimonadota bacterium]